MELKERQSPQAGSPFLPAYFQQQCRFSSERAEAPQRNHSSSKHRYSMAVFMVSTDQAGGGTSLSRSSLRNRGRGLQFAALPTHRLCTTTFISGRILVQRGVLHKKSPSSPSISSAPP
jgi:hypothetical protein